MSKTDRVALIREAECIGCTKCIQACPVDAIVGAAQLMHTVIEDHCIGCDLCVPPCPVDCIDMIEVESERSKDEQRARAKLAKQRVQARNQRLEKIEKQKAEERQRRIEAFNASPEANDLIKQAMARAEKARSGKTDKQRVEYTIEKLEKKLLAMRTELAEAQKNDRETAELERRIATWEEKLKDTREDLEKYQD